MGTDLIQINVIGLPAPQGSKSAFVRGGRAVVVEGSSKSGRAGHAAWRQAVATATRDWLGEHPRPTIDEPVHVSMVFWFPPVKSDPYRTRHITKPDLSKLIRATEDAMVDGGLLKDDSCVFSLAAQKRYTSETPPGCSIGVESFGEAEGYDRERRKAIAREQRKQRKEGQR